MGERTKFEVGDRVVLINPNYGSRIPIYSVGTISPWQYNSTQRQAVSFDHEHGLGLVPVWNEHMMLYEIYNSELYKALNET